MKSKSKTWLNNHSPYLSLRTCFFSVFTLRNIICVHIRSVLISDSIIHCVLAFLYESLTVRMSVCRYVRLHFSATTENCWKEVENIVDEYWSITDASICPPGLVFLLCSFMFFRLFPPRFRFSSALRRFWVELENFVQSLTFWRWECFLEIHQKRKKKEKEDKEKK